MYHGVIELGRAACGGVLALHCEQSQFGGCGG